MTENEILTLTETAQYLKVAEKTVHRLIKDNKIPCVRVGGQWRFMKSMIDDWLISRMEVVPKNDLAAVMENGITEITISGLVSGIIHPLSGKSGEEVLKNLIVPLVRDGNIRNSDKYLEKLVNRENMASTAIGEGIAIPHIRNPRENESSVPRIVIGISDTGIDFNAVDGKPVRLFFLVHTNSETLHLKILSKISVLFRDTENRENLIKAASVGDAKKTLRKIEKIL